VVLYADWYKTMIASQRRGAWRRIQEICTNEAASLPQHLSCCETPVRISEVAGCVHAPRCPRPNRNPRRFMARAAGHQAGLRALCRHYSHPCASGCYAVAFCTTFLQHGDPRKRWLADLLQKVYLSHSATAQLSACLPRRSGGRPDPGHGRGDRGMGVDQGAAAQAQARSAEGQAAVLQDRE
jgi:hypothetical protein